MLLTSSFPPALGGVETLLYQTSRRLADPPLVLAAAPAAATDLTVTPVGVTLAARAAYRPLWALHPSLHYVLRFWRSAARALRAWRPRVLIAGHIYLAPLVQMLARRAGLPHVVCAYGQEVWRAGRSMGLHEVDRRLRGGALRAADAVLVPGRFTADLVSQWGVDWRRIRCIPFGAEARPLVEPGEGLLSVARLVPRKGIDTVIRALPELEDSVRYRVVGSGPDEQRLRSLAEQCGVAARVAFLGRIDDEQLAAEYRRCRLFVLPARRTADGQLEGYGLVYFEAAAWGRPVVAGRSGGEVDAVVDGETGVLVDGESVQSVSATLRALLADPERCAVLGRAGHARVEKTHNWSAAARAVDAVLEALA